MKHVTLLSFALFFLCLSGFAQDWQTNFTDAQKEANQTGKRLILVFQGSDWCAPCMKLDREIWSTPEFSSYAADHYVMVKADFPRKKANALPEEQQIQNSKLAEKYNTKGYFPFVVVLSPDGKVLGETGYKHISPKEYIEQLDSF